MKYLTLLLTIVLFTSKVNSQSVLNGSFEQNTVSSCATNQANTSFNLSMNDCFAFGSGSEIDIQDSTCGYSNPANGDWFISLATPGPGMRDALSLKLSAPLIVGQNYQILYYQKADTSMTTLDSLQIGVSLSNNTLGTIVHRTQPMSETNWTLNSFSFTSPLAAEYLTFSNEGSIRGWNFIDDIQLNIVNGVPNYSIDNSVQVFPNPTRGNVNISVPNGVDNIKVYNSIGSLVYNKDNDDRLVLLNLELNEDGLYYILISSEKGSITTKKVLVSSDY
jgi:hypothetical protein